MLGVSDGLISPIIPESIGSIDNIPCSGCTKEGYCWFFVKESGSYGWACSNCGMDDVEYRLFIPYQCSICESVFRSKQADYLCAPCRYELDRMDSEM